MKNLPFSLPSLSALFTLLTAGAFAAPPAAITSFLDTHCYECHDDLTTEGDLNLLDLDFDMSDPGALRQWIDVLDRVKAGEMPPEKQPRPDAKETGEFLSLLEKPLAKADEALIAERGRARPRRLNRSEYETALEDLFGMPFHVKENLPEDAKSHGFDTVGDALNVSSVQIQSYLDVLDGALDRATTLYPEPERRTHRLTYRESGNIMQVYRKGGPFHIRKDGVAFFATEKFSHHNAVLEMWTAPHTARYKVKVSAYALRADEPVVLSLRAGGTGHAESNHVPHVFLEHFSVPEGGPEIFEWEGWLERGHYFHVYPTSLPAMRFAGKNEEQRQHEYKGPAVVVQWVEVDGPIFDEWPPASHRRLWGTTKTEPATGVEPNKDPIEHLDHPPAKTAKPRLTRNKKPDRGTGNRFVYDPDQGVGGEPIHRAAAIPKPLISTLCLNPSDPAKKARELLMSFAEKAFRRPVREEEIASFHSLVNRWMQEGSDFESAMRVAYKAILTSPDFLYHRGTLPDESSELDDYALAERLSFFLWNGLPDKTLLALAEKGSLSQAETRSRQADRMLNDPRSDRFLETFLGSWLDLDLIDFTVPDEKLYPEHDKLLQWSMVEETTSFVRKLIDEDLPAANLIDSDFAMVNWRLAKHYGLPPVEGMAVRAVALPDGSPRGGIMTQGSVLKVTANGTTTSPVVRGVWLLERIMGIHPEPPPPGVPAIEPDIRGAVSIRDQLEKHRNIASCYNCHAKIDPPGVALESFDVIGGWRDHYRALNEDLIDLKPRYSPFQPVPIRYVKGQPVDASYDLIDGRHFDDINGFKQLLLSDERQIARGVVEKLVIYSTGAEISFSDRSEIETILDRAEAGRFGFRTLISEVVASELFSRK